MATIMTTTNAFLYSNIDIPVSGELIEYTKFLYKELFVSQRISEAKRVDSSDICLSNSEIVSVFPFPIEELGQITFSLVRSTVLSELFQNVPLIEGITSLEPTVIIGRGDIRPHVDINRRSSLNKLIWSDANMELVIEDVPIKISSESSWYLNVSKMHYVRNAHDGFAILTISSTEQYESIIQRG